MLANAGHLAEAEATLERAHTVLKRTEGTNPWSLIHLLLTLRKKNGWPGRSLVASLAGRDRSRDYRNLLLAAGITLFALVQMTNFFWLIGLRIVSLFIASSLVELEAVSRHPRCPRRFRGAAAPVVEPPAATFNLLHHPRHPGYSSRRDQLSHGLPWKAGEGADILDALNILFGIPCCLATRWSR